jgi:hypothetical protein
MVVSANHLAVTFLDRRAKRRECSDEHMLDLVDAVPAAPARRSRHRDHVSDRRRIDPRGRPPHRVGFGAKALP